MKKYSPFLMEGLLFSVILGLGIVNAFKLNRFFEVERISPTSVSAWHFILYFVFATFFVLAISFLSKKFKKQKDVIFKIIFVLAVVWGSLITFSLWLPDLLSLVLVAVLIFAWLKKPTVLLHNLAIIFGLAGIGSVLGLSISPLVVVILLLIFSVYDVVSVYITKHMIKMAKEMISSGAILGIIVPHKISDFNWNLKEVKADGRFLILGGGDIAFPLILCASLISFGVLSSVIVAIFSLIGLFVSFYFFVNQKKHRPIPALPPIALFSIIGYLVTLAI